MPQMNFDLEDGQEPVSFLLSSADSERFMAFMAHIVDLRWYVVVRSDNNQI